MDYIPFYEFYPEIAENETRSVLLTQKMGNLPAGSYTFVESYCTSLDNCARVFLNVVYQGKTKRFEGKFLATIGYGWQDVDYYAKYWRDLIEDGTVTAQDMKGPQLEPLQYQSELAHDILELAKSQLFIDPKYTKRLKKHSKLVDQFLEKNKSKIGTSTKFLNNKSNLDDQGFLSLLDDIAEDYMIFEEEPNDIYDISKSKLNNLMNKKGWIRKTDKAFNKPSSGKKDIRFFRTFSSGSIILIVSIPYNNTYSNLAFLVDLWKVGVKDLIERKSSRDRAISDIEQSTNEIVRISMKEAIYLLVRGYRMAQEMNYTIAKRVMKWLKKLRVPEKNVKGSPFKCFTCETGNLDDKDILLIKDVAREDMINGTLGTPSEHYLFFECDKCRTGKI